MNILELLEKHEIWITEAVIESKFNNPIPKARLSVVKEHTPNCIINDIMEDGKRIKGMEIIISLT